MRKIIFLLYLTLCIYNYDCPLSHYQKTQMYSDRVHIQSPNNRHKVQDLVYKYHFDNAFQKTPRVGLGLNQLYSDQSPFLEVILNVAQIQEDGIYFHAKTTQKSQWKNLKLNFLATTRDDIQLGIASVQKPHYFENDHFNIHYPLKKQPGHGFKVKYFIQGFDLQSIDQKHLGIKHYATSIQQKQIIITFSNRHRTTLVNSLTITIIGFNIYTPGVLYSDGIIDQNFIVSQTQITIPKHGINQLRTYLVGINSFQAFATQPISISSSIDQKFVLHIGPIDRYQIDYISVSYLIISIIDCGSCLGYPILYDGICRLQCPHRTILKNGKCIPIQCTDGHNLNHHGQCIPKCKQYEQYTQNRCVCIDGYNLINEKCSKCPQGTFFNYKTLQCEKLCGKNSEYYNGHCHCLEGYYNFHNSCQKCPQEMRYNQYLNQCQTICSYNEIYTEKGCQCKPDFYKIRGKCGKCQGYSYYNQKYQICQCMKGFQWNHWKQSCLHSCAQDQVFIDGKCHCQKQFYHINGICGLCPLGSIYSQKQETCLCGYKQKYLNGTCIPQCDDRQYYDHKIEKCVPYCSQYAQIWKDHKCICAHGYKRNLKDKICYPQCGPYQQRVEKKCQCISGYHMGVNGNCQRVKCPSGLKWNQKKKQCRSDCHFNQIYSDGKCICAHGYILQTQSGVCLPRCPYGKIRKNGRCVCPNGNINGKCINCPKNTQYLNGVCLCYNGKLPYNGKCKHSTCPDVNQTWDPIVKACHCRKPLTWIRGRCQHINTCEYNQYWNGISCVCRYGFILKYGKCMPVFQGAPQCPANSTFNGVNCQCISGFYPITEGKCGHCPHQTYWNGHHCEMGDYACAEGYNWNIEKNECISQKNCGLNQYWDGIICRCSQGTFLIEQKCQKCQQGTFFDGQKCSKTKIPDCMDPYKFWNGRECVCIQGYFDMSNKCVKCPLYTNWNGVCCKVQKGHHVNFTVPVY